MSDHTAYVGWLLKMSIKPGQADGFEALAREMSAHTKANEPGALTFMWYRNGDHVQIYEHYADSEAAMTHLGNFGTHFGERFMAMFEISGFWIYGSPSDAVREALGPFQPEYLTAAAGFSR